MQNHTYSAGKTALTIFGLGTAYAAALAHLERRYPIKPDHTWAEVAGGVIITLAPVIAARRRHKLSVCQFEELLMLAFIASGTPIILWQIAESLLRSGSIGTPAERRLRYELRNLPVSTLARLCHRAQHQPLLAGGTTQGFNPRPALPPGATTMEAYFGVAAWFQPSPGFATGRNCHAC